MWAKVLLWNLMLSMEVLVVVANHQTKSYRILIDHFQQIPRKYYASNPINCVAPVTSKAKFHLTLKRHLCRKTIS